MGRRQNDSGFGRFTLLSLFLVGAISCFAVYLFLTVVFRPSTAPVSSLQDLDNIGGLDGLRSNQEEEGSCCGGVEHLELWGDAVKWGAEFRVNSSEECCMACRSMCRGGGVPCLCNSWVFCGDREACGPRFGEGIVGLETDLGILRIKIFRAESRGSFWDSEGNHIKKAPFGPPFALIQGTFQSLGSIFKDVPKERCPIIRRGSVAWIGSGPEFFISLANHNEWTNTYTVFGFVLSEDMEILEKVVQLQTKPEVWNGIDVSVLENTISLRFRRITTQS